MKISHITAVLFLLAVLSISSVHAQTGIPTISTSSSVGSSFLSGLTSGNSYIYAGFFAIVMFIIFAIALDRTQLSSGRIAISFIFALITFFLLYTDNTLLHFFLNTFIVLAFIALILGMLAAVKSPRSIRLIGLIVALFLILILFENDSGLTNSVNSILHINILSILPLVFGIIAVAVFIILLLRGVKTHSNIVLRVILLFIVFLLIALLIPGFAAFLFSPIVLIPLFVAILLVIFLIRKGGRHGPKLSKQDKLDLKQQKKAQKDAKLQNKVLSSIANRKQSNDSNLQEYRNLMKKGNLTPDEQLKVAQLKNKLANEAWQNVADRTKLTQAQYSKKQLSNNKDLQKLTGFFSRDQALKNLKSNAKSNYKLSWSQKRALKKQQNNLNKKNTFISNTGNSQAGDLFDLANAAKKGGLGPVQKDKAARKLFDKQISKESRNKDVSALLNERNKLLDPTLNLSNSTRRKEVAKIDKKLKKISSNISPKSPDQVRQNNLIKEQQEQRRQEMLEEQRLADAQLEAARRNAERERAERERLAEQAKLAEAARQQAEHDRLIREQQEQRRQEMLEEQRRADAQLDALKRAEQQRAAEAAKQEAENRKQQADLQNATSGIVGPSSAFDKRVKTPLWFSHKSPVDKNGKLDVQMQNQIEATGLMDRRQNLVSLINSGKLSGRQLKDARNELNRIDYRLKKYGRDIHR
ncbi:hypothetical protein M1494_02715 [Candidatus Parvarchaeota archaeon]|nr:hypothetical protein [Candidatus Parvarchaeota archaeon]